MTFAEHTKRTVLDFYQPVTGMRPVKGDIGIEIEIEGEGNLTHACTGWTVHEDNSLRGPGGIARGGVEYVTKGAIAADNVLSCVQRLREILIKAGVRFREDSPRTSTHIHVNVQDLPLIDVFGFITVFAAIEPMFLHLCGPRRDGNSFCTPSYDTGDLPDYFHDAFRQIERYSTGGYIELPQRGKYASLGTFRLHDLGTLECRCFPFSVNPEEIQTWSNWLMNLKNLVRRQDDKSFRGLIKLGIHDPMVLAQSIFMTAQGFPMGITTNLAAELIQYGSREAYELTRLMKFFLNKKPSEKKHKKGNVYGEDVMPQPAEDEMIHDEIQLQTGQIFQANNFGGWAPAPQPPVAPAGPLTFRRRGV